MSSKDFQVRYYEKEMPSTGDVVMVKVEKMADTSCYVRLVEYDNIEGMIPFTELSRRRIRSISQLAKVGKHYVATVIRMDQEKRYIDLSKKQVTAEERKACEERYTKAKQVASLCCWSAKELKRPPVEVMDAVAWPLYRKHQHAYDALKIAVKNPDQILKPLNLDAELLAKMTDVVQIRLKTEPVKVQADINVTCFTPAGVDAIREVLLLGQETGKGDDGLFVHVAVEAPPTYVIHTTTEDKEAGFAKLQLCIDAMKEEMERRGGNVEVAVPPRVMGEDKTAIGVEEADHSSDED